MTRSPILCHWTGAAFEPVRVYAKAAARMFRSGEVYEFDAAPTRSINSERHYHAKLREIHASLPEAVAELFPNVESLRQHALIRCGFANRQDVVCDSEREALAFVSCLKRADPYSVAVIRERVVSIWTPMSQSREAMGADIFQRSRQSVLEFCADMIGVHVEELQTESA